MMINLRSLSEIRPVSHNYMSYMACRFSKKIPGWGSNSLLKVGFRGLNYRKSEQKFYLYYRNLHENEPDSAAVIEPISFFCSEMLKAKNLIRGFNFAHLLDFKKRKRNSTPSIFNSPVKYLFTGRFSYPERELNDLFFKKRKEVTFKPSKNSNTYGILRSLLQIRKKLPKLC